MQCKWDDTTTFPRYVSACSLVFRGISELCCSGIATTRERAEPFVSNRSSYAPQVAADMARGRKFKRGGGKAKPEAAEAKLEQELAETPMDSTVVEAEVSTESVEPAKVVEKALPVKDMGGLEGTPEGQGGVSKEVKEEPNKEKKTRVKKGKKPAADGNKGPTAVKGAVKKVIDFAGLIFMCNTNTKKDCFKYRVFGFPEAKRETVERARKGIKLFLFDIDQRVLYGIYKASSPGGMNLEGEAFQDSDRKFPAQIRFRIHKECLPIDESVFKPLIKENYFGRNKFKCELSFEQVGKLTQLFRPLDARGFPKPKPGKEPRRETLSSKGSTPHGKEGRRESFSKGGVPRGTRTRALPTRGAPNYVREPPYAREYPPSRPKERLPIELDPRSQPGYYSSQVLPNPDIGLLEAEALYRQRLQMRQLQDARIEALDRRAYILDPLMDASLRQVGAFSEPPRQRIPGDLYMDERSLMLPKQPLLQEDLYRDLPYQREILHSNHGDGLHAFSATLPYESLTTLPWRYP